MSKIYVPLSESELATTKKAIADYHPWLNEYEIQIAFIKVLKFNADEDPIPCLKHHGALAAATIRVLKPTEQLFRPHAAEVLIDGCLWEMYSEASRLALIDHELEHLVLAKNKKGEVLRSDNGKIKLRMKPDDFSLTGFYAVAQRHGNNALEVVSVSRVSEKLTSLLPAAATSAAVALVNVVVANSSEPLVETVA